MSHETWFPGVALVHSGNLALSLLTAVCLRRLDMYYCPYTGPKPGTMLFIEDVPKNPSESFNGRFLPDLYNQKKIIRKMFGKENNK